MYSIHLKMLDPLKSVRHFRYVRVNMMKATTRLPLYICLISLLALLASPLSRSDSHGSLPLKDLQIVNLKHPSTGVYTSGQPTQAQLQGLAKSGVKRIINLRPPGESDLDEKTIVEALGMEYVNIPVAGASGVTPANAKQLEKLLQDSSKPTLVHCASSNRVGALVALAAGKDATSSEQVDAAIAKGKQYGLGSLEPVVRKQLD